MTTHLLSLLMLLQASLSLAEADNDVAGSNTIECGPATTNSLRLAGIRASNQIVQEWAEAYSQVCPFSLEIEEDTWPDSGARMCGNHLLYPTVDVSGMGGKFFRPQATTTDGWNFDCYRTGRKAIQIKIADEGISIVTSASDLSSEKGKSSDMANDAKSCIAKLGGRWIFSGQSLKALEAEGMDVETVVPNFDGRDDTHLWSELHADCSPIPILLAGMKSSHHEGEAIAYLRDSVLTARNEDLRQNDYQEFGTLSDFATFLQENPNAIGFTSIGDFEYAKDDLAAVSPVGIQAAHGATVEFVLPNDEAFLDGTYPLSDKVTIGVWNTPEVLAAMRPFVKFGLSEEGTRLLTRSGYWPLGSWERILDITRMGLSENLGEDDGVTGISLQRITDSCGNMQGSQHHFAIAGSTDVFVVARTWADFYQSGCPSIEINVEGGGSSSGAARVCANRRIGSPVDVGTMARDWKPVEALERTASVGVYDCESGDQSRSAIRIAVAYDGITVVIREGSVAAACLDILGGGLTLHQLRWIYSSYSDAQLEETGWDPKSLKNSDGDSSTHLWSELDSRCASVEMHLAGDRIGDGTYTTFKETLLVDSSNGETIAVNRPKPYLEGAGAGLVSLLQQERDTIGYIGYNHYFANQDVFRAVAIQTGNGKNIEPSAQTIAGGSYPFVRQIFMNLNNDPRSLASTVPYVKFGLQNPIMVESLGLVPIQGQDLNEMMARLEGAPYPSSEKLDDDDGEGMTYGAIVGISVGGGVGLLCICLICVVWISLHEKNSRH